MIRVALRQFRTEGLVGVGVLAVIAAVLLVTGLHLAQVNDAFERACKTAGDCATAQNPVLEVDKPLQSALPFVVTIAPALIGLFFGAPLVAREIETGTFRLAWTQSVTRRRWLAVKVGVVGLSAMAIGGLLTWMADWWASPIDALTQNRFGLAQFGSHGVAPIGYAAFAFALGTATGVLLRRTIAAMAVTGAGFAAARVAVADWVRPRFAAPLHRYLPLPAAAVGKGFGFRYGGPGNVSFEPPPQTVPNAWVYSTAVVDKAGHAPSSRYLLRACPALGQAPPRSPPGTKATAGAPGATPIAACVQKLSATLHTVVTYQPGSRFWPFQWAEMAVFLAAALALCALTYWWLRRRYA